MVAIVVAIGGYFFPQVQSALGDTGGSTNYSQLGTTQMRIGTGCGNEFKFNACAGTPIFGDAFGTCYVQASTITIAASSTATVDCQASTNGTQAPLSNVAAGDTVVADFATTTSSVSDGIDIVGVSASSTPGYITMKVANATGGTFTWTSSASSTNYIDLANAGH